MEPEPDFEAALNELERIVGDLERGDIALAGALLLYERGVRLLGHCHGLLDGAERTVALLAGIDSDGQPQTTPFDTTATAERDLAEPKADPKPRSPRSRKSNDDIPF